MLSRGSAESLTLVVFRIDGRVHLLPEGFDGGIFEVEGLGLFVRIVVFASEVFRFLRILRHGSSDSCSGRAGRWRCRRARCGCPGRSGRCPRGPQRWRRQLLQLWLGREWR